jgi:hypothetical protein
MMPTGFEDLGFTPTGFEDLGFVPHNEQSPQQQPEQQQGFAQKIINNPLMQGVYGAGDAFTNALSFGYLGDAAKNMGAGNPENLSYKLGQLGGNIGAAAIPGSLAGKAIRAGMLGAKAVPYASLLGNMAGGAEWGFAANPGDRVVSALEGAAVPLALKGVGMAIKPLAKGASAFGKRLININPAKYEREFARHGTNEYLEQIAKPSSEIYQNIENKTAGQPISYITDTLDKLNNISPEAQSMYSSNSSLSRVRNAFDKNREYKTAHKLWKTLGDEYRDLMKTKAKAGSFNTEQAQKVNGILQERKALNSFINENVEGLGLKGEFQKANLLHRKDVIPARNEATILNDYINTEGKVIDKRGLTNALSKASSKNAMFRKPIPKETLSLNKRYEQSLNNLDLIQKLSLYGLGGLGVGGVGAMTGKHFMGGR